MQPHGRTLLLFILYPKLILGKLEASWAVGAKAQHKPYKDAVTPTMFTVNNSQQVWTLQGHYLKVE